MTDKVFKLYRKRDGKQVGSARDKWRLTVDLARLYLHNKGMSGGIVRPPTPSEVIQLKRSEREANNRGYELRTVPLKRNRVREAARRAVTNKLMLDLIPLYNGEPCIKDFVEWLMGELAIKHSSGYEVVSAVSSADDRMAGENLLSRKRDWWIEQLTTLKRTNKQRHTNKKREL